MKLHETLWFVFAEHLIGHWEYMQTQEFWHSQGAVFIAFVFWQELETVAPGLHRVSDILAVFKSRREDEHREGKDMITNTEPDYTQSKSTTTTSHPWAKHCLILVSPISLYLLLHKLSIAECTETQRQYKWSVCCRTLVHTGHIEWFLVSNSFLCSTYHCTVFQPWSYPGSLLRNWSSWTLSYFRSSYGRNGRLSCLFVFVSKAFGHSKPIAISLCTETFDTVLALVDLNIARRRCFVHRLGFFDINLLVFVS